MDWFGLLMAVVVSQAPGTGSPARWQAALTGFDTIRAQALVLGAPELLASVYPSGSELLEQDRALLAAYESRGVDIESVDLTVLTVRILREEPRRVRLQVIDKVASTRVLLPDGTRRQLPHDRATRRTVELTFAGGSWRISSVRP